MRQKNTRWRGAGRLLVLTSIFVSVLLFTVQAAFALSITIIDDTGTDTLELVNRIEDANGVTITVTSDPAAATISGYVRDASGTGVPGLNVFLSKNGGGTINTTTSSLDVGNYSFAGLSNGTYYIIVLSPTTCYKFTPVAPATSNSIKISHTSVTGPDNQTLDFTADPCIVNVVDTQPPGQPSNLQATAYSSSQIDLSWGASTDNVGVTGYKVYRGGTEIKTVSGTSASDTGLTASTQYCYKVAAYDAANNTSAQSSEKCATTSVATGDTQAPSVPSNLQATVAGTSQINLTWGASTDNVAVTGYNLYRGGSFVKTVSGTSTSDTGLTASTQYCYTVAAYDAVPNTSAQSSQACATTSAGDTGGKPLPAGATTDFTVPGGGTANFYITLTKDYLKYMQVMMTTRDWTTNQDMFISDTAYPTCDRIGTAATRQPSLTNKTLPAPWYNIADDNNETVTMYRPFMKASTPKLYITICNKSTGTGKFGLNSGGQ